VVPTQWARPESVKNQLPTPLKKRAVQRNNQIINTGTQNKLLFSLYVVCFMFLK
jgi:hypothetical protein